ncbi:hypothetical protein CU254_42590 (plasmid) [Amycolatopsis sp. AA4]|uniref:hypothetical protein n=1 Tax=Actinomycetes TaxID=1760 RepID=UPI0001B57BDC|nr:MULTISPECIES: hypothetical protein [Actinomycetes]ATY17276.1 hypothetical protein CU254_42590 [Amycolatopsis sp. AA4]EFL12747.1 predicted protein [Streptomyces sp. AA4]
MIRANDDAAIGWDDAKWLVGNGKAKRNRIPVPVLCYEPPIYRCSQCGTPCTGVMCLSCTTQ